MKRILKRFILTVGLVCTFIVSYAQVAVDNIGSSLGSGNVNGVSRYFDNTVSVTISGSQSTYSRSQAEMVLRDFFGKNNAQGFSMEHSSENNGSSYAIGTLNTAKGKYRAYFSMRQKEGSYVIQEIRIEK